MRRAYQKENGGAKQHGGDIFDKIDMLTPHQPIGRSRISHVAETTPEHT